MENSKNLFEGVGLLPGSGDMVPDSLKGFGNDNGVYLETVELQNWGPFSGITEIPLMGLPALLVGENGTGKSSLMDAILTLLISRDLHYNNASDSKRSRADERTLMEYVLGVAGSSMSGEEAGNRKEMKYLRRTGEVSVILLRFRSGTEFMTVANVFLAEEGKKDPQRFYAFAKRSLSVRSDFSSGSANFEGFRSSIGQIKGVTVTADRNRYFTFIRTEIGLSDDNSMKLLRNLSSMKSLPEPDEFIREHMLPGRINYRMAFEEMKQAIEEVNEIGRRLKEARRRFVMLEELKPFIEKAKSLQEEKSLWENVRDKVTPYVYRIGKPAAEREISRLEDNKAGLEEKISKLEDRKNNYIATKAALAAELSSMGGNMVIQKKAELSSFLKEKDRRQSLKDKITPVMETLGVSCRFSTEQAFKKAMDVLAGKKAELEESYGQCIITKAEASHALDEATARQREIERQKYLLEQGSQTMPVGLVAVRDEVCDALGVPYETMPFLGSFLSVREGEEEWRPVLEHLLYNESVSFLVPMGLEDKVAGYLRKHKRSREDIRYKFMKPIKAYAQDNKDNLERAWEKIEVRQGTPFTGWVEAFLKGRASHFCCDTAEQYASCYPAIMKDGQIRSNIIDNRKNERMNIFDPGNFVMSGSFEEKKKAVIQSVKAIEIEVASARKNFVAAVNKLEAVNKDKDIFGDMPFISSFSDIDIASIEAKIADCEESVAALEDNSSTAKIKEKIRGTEDAVAKVMESIASTRQEAESVIARLGSLKAQSSSYSEALSSVSFNTEEEEVLKGLYTKYGPGTAAPKFESIMATATKVSSAVSRKLSDTAVACDRECRETESRMRAYLDEFKSRRADLVPSMESPGEADKFLAELKSVTDDSLPEAVKAYNEIKNFGKLDALRHFVSITTSGVDQEIRKAIEDINGILKKVPYSQGVSPTFLQVNCLRNRDGEVVALREMLSRLARAKGLAVLSDTTAEEADSIMTMAEELITFLQPRVSRIRKDKYYENNILDPRNWFVFPVSVCREEVMGNGEVEVVHVKELDKTNKQSSGEGEKFTYFILAACYAIWMHLLDPDYGGRTFRFLMIDEIGNKLSPSNLHDVIALFDLLKVQLVSILPHGDKVSEYEGFVGNIVQTDWVDKKAGVSFADTISLTDYARKNRKRIEERVRLGRQAKERAGKAGEKENEGVGR